MQNQVNAARVDILILGAGWTSTFLIPLCVERQVSYTATSRPSHPKPDTVPFEFDEHDAHPDQGQFAVLPGAKTVLVTFPINAPGASARLVRLYKETHPNAEPHFMQLGSSGIWDVRLPLSLRPSARWNRKAGWLDRHSPYSETNTRAAAEAELLALSPETPTTVLNLSGLFGGPRAVKHVVGRVAPTKEALKSSGSLHMIHGIDVARAILAVHDNFRLATGQRWMLTNTRVYDWWDLAATWGTDAENKRGPQARWVRELMREEGVRALPRTPEQIGRALDSRDFWDTFELEPVIAQLD
ncbi:uncharacterized protein PHACADRAFT_90130 [Phanerochaete carnosa HHB-10118-sp]|uniref:NAD-dependent epimerase/dehydratase domain-containing protein n=1 Tax=Phanerochaete carnosa (strain HHB-10118-sp) TaxID=650164 RepID=K5WGW1_PHACS|nr:uncharacterized protein PHACADRAFT_90130 [Phanerochaete carnosa HHB-10118-sp]EKM58570.1 hypothetical protein PHACADRAFT_90130 [Phanerochaete carnosa HHB-10118-sp]